jgi:hypothetical protein
MKGHYLSLSNCLYFCAVIAVVTAWPVLVQPRLDADDYRYLDHFQQWKAGNMGMIEAMTVENRWDHLWFMEEDGVIRFFRPTVVLSYAADRALWGEHYALGLTITNVLLHIACSMLVGLILYRIIGPGLPSMLGALLFAGLATHSECIWYIAGRTDSLAALGFLGAFALHLSGRRWWALPCFVCGLLTKELVVMAPVLFVVYDLWVERRKWDWHLYGVYGVLTFSLLLLKKIALGGQGSDFVYPYLIAPFSAEFPGHIWLQIRSYAGNLFAAEVTIPFADAETVHRMHGLFPPLFGAGTFIAICCFLWHDRRFHFFLLFWLLMWLPTSFVYLSERYLYLPSVAFAAMPALIASTRPPMQKYVISVLLGFFVAFHGVMLYNRHKVIAGKPGSVREMITQFEALPEEIEPGAHLLLVNLPGYFVRAQFCEAILRVAANDPELKVDVLTVMPEQNGVQWKHGDPLPVMGAFVVINQAGEKNLELMGRVLGKELPPHRIQQEGLKRFAWAPLEAGARYATSTGIEAVVADSDEGGATALAFDLPRKVAAYTLLVWRADCSELNEHPWDRRRDAKVERIIP